MKQNLPVKKNDGLTLFVDSLSLEGQGVAKKDGFVVFVPGALPGETVNAHVIKVASGYAVAKLLSVETPSPARVEPACPALPACGGCALQHLDYQEQLSVKQRAVADALTRLGGFDRVPMRPIIGMRHPYRYRNKGSFPFASVGGMVRFGFFAPRSHRLVPMLDCPIQDERIVSVMRRVQEWAGAYDIPAYDETSRTGLLRHCMARVTTNGQVMAVLVTASGRVRRLDELIELLPDVDSLYLNINPDDTNVIFGEKFVLLAGAPTIEETVSELRFSVSPQSFLQVNAVQTAALYGAAKQMLDAAPAETVVDAYCGIGTISLLIARSAGRVIGLESVPEAVEDARRNAALNGIENASFVCGDAAETLSRVLKTERVDAVVADPPRKGMDEAVLSLLAESGVSRVVYVSCNPATLARDCRYLAEHGGFTLSAVQSVDMFPHAGHVECVVLMSRVK